LLPSLISRRITAELRRMLGRSSMTKPRMPTSHTVMSRTMSDLRIAMLSGERTPSAASRALASSGSSPRMIWRYEALTCPSDPKS
jgi:hypothetical protein